MSYEPGARFDWVPFYQDLATRLLGFKARRQDLIHELQRMYSRLGIKFPKLDSTEIPDDIDPFTVFGLFNKGITLANKRKIASGLGRLLGASMPVPTSFAGTPTLNNLNATFYAFADDSRRGERDIDNLWSVFESALALASDDNDLNRAEFIDAFDATVGQFGLGWKLTMGLFWVRPQTFINLDSRSRWYLADAAKAGGEIAEAAPKTRDAVPSGSDYLLICDTVRSHLNSPECPSPDFPSLSDAAYVESERVNRERKAAEKEAERQAEENALGDAGVETPRYWLFSPGEHANKWDDFLSHSVMAVGWSALGPLDAYESRESIRHAMQDLLGSETTRTNSSLAAWQFAHEMKPGDIVFVRKGRSEILGRGVVTGDYSYEDAESEYPSFRTVTWTHVGNWAMEEKMAMKTLTDISDYSNLIDKINSLFTLDEGDPSAEPELPLPSYDRDQFLSEAFMDEDSFDALSGVLRAKKCVILQGAPGVGKTFVAKRLAYATMGVKDLNRVMMVQFHQSYSYEDFIKGFRPSATGFELVKGSFYTFCKKAAEDAENDYFFIIDEINRGNLSKIFGELFMLIENDKRGPRNKLQLLYSRELFYVPSNVYIIGMMNTADRSLAMLDYALRRRFAFFDLKPGFETDGFTTYLRSLGSSAFARLISTVCELNKEIQRDEMLGEGFCIGHSYFCNLQPHEDLALELSAIIEYELVPLLREYWFDEPQKVLTWSEALRRSIQ